MKLTKINNEYELILPDHRADRPEWVTGWEAERIKDMLDNIDFDDVVFDIGTEEGDISALLSQWCDGKIVLFEPNPRVWPNIKAIWEANRLKKPKGKFVGFAGNEDTYEKFQQPINKSTWPISAYGELIGDHGFKELSKEADSIPQIKIDTFCREAKIYPTVITMDVEGSEFQVLKGAEQTLRERKPLVYVSVHPEFMHEQYGQFTAELVKFMTDLDYSFEILAFDHEFHFKFKSK